jgi:DNA-binding PadR family transcriptional regulator
MDGKDLYLGFIRLHVLHHACQEPIFGLGVIEELARHDHRLSPGTLYPLLHGLEESGYLRSSSGGKGRRSHRVYRATPKGRRALAAAKVEVRELFSELLEDEHPENCPLRKTAASKYLISELVAELKAVTLPKLRRGVSEVKEPMAQALLETSAEVVEGLIKAFDNYKRKRGARSQPQRT